MHQIASPVDDLIWNLAEDLEATAWMGRGRCGEADPVTWFPEKGGTSREPATSAQAVKSVPNAWSTRWNDGASGRGGVWEA